MAQSCKTLRRCNYAGVSSACHCLLCSFICTHIPICINICICTINKDINYFTDYCKNFGLCNSDISNKPKQPSCHYEDSEHFLFINYIFFQEGKREKVNLEISPWLSKDSRNWTQLSWTPQGWKCFTYIWTFVIVFHRMIEWFGWEGP